MNKLPVVSGKEAVNKFKKIGYLVTRQKGSHVRLVPTGNNPVQKSFTIPLHKTLKPGLLSQLIKDAGITVKEFISL
ncbi:MAG: type II toxin-antitoxin system HicA family toxin [bacterium]|nr:type II toxin-antitoxin system HicA family toxin [bacterium]